METQIQKILNHLKIHKSITSWEAIQKYRVTRLSAVIFVLRERGYDIISNREYNEETGTNYARYVLMRSKNWSEEDLLDLSRDEFTARFEVADEEYEMLHKEMQEM